MLSKKELLLSLIILLILFSSLTVFVSAVKPPSTPVLPDDGGGYTGPVCGNTVCESGETCYTCSTDCGSCCGNGSCQIAYGETCSSCPSDCGECGLNITEGQIGEADNSIPIVGPAIVRQRAARIYYSTLGATIKNPTRTQPVNVSPGEAVQIGFVYDYYCASGYRIDVFQDNNPSNLICSKTLIGLGWEEAYSYGGTKACTYTALSNLVSELCPLSANAMDGNYTVKVSVFDQKGKLALSQKEKSAIIVKSNNPDLIVYSLSVSPDKLTEGGKVKISATIYNIGFMDALNFEVEAFVQKKSSLPGNTANLALNDSVFEKKSFGIKSVDSLMVGEEKTVEFELDSFGLTGAFNVIAAIDPANKILESNELNNENSANLFVSSNNSTKPDLLIESFTVDETLIDAGQTMFFEAKISNKGKTRAENINIILEPFTYASVSPQTKKIDLLEPGKTASISFEFFETANLNGKIPFILTVDYTNSVDELNETNNTASIDVNVFGTAPIIPVEEKCYDGKDNDLDGLIDEDCAPDLAIYSLGYGLGTDGSKIFPNASGFVLAGEKSLPFYIPLKSESVEGGLWTYQYINGLADFCVNLEGPNDYYLKIVYGMPFLGSTDKAVQDLKNYVEPGKNIQNYLEFLDAFGGVIEYHLLYNGQILDLPSAYRAKISSMSLSSKGFLFDPISLGLKPGDYSISFIGDCTYKLGLEKDNLNNKAMFFVKVLGAEQCNGFDDNNNGLIDEGCSLELQSLYSPALAPKNCAIELKARILNNGSIKSNEIIVGLYKNSVSSNNFLDSIAVPELNPGQSFNFSFFGVPSDFAHSTKFVLFKDSDHNFFEENQSIAAKQMLLPDFELFSEKPNLKIASISADKSKIREGDKIKLKVVVENTGFEDIENAQIKIQLKSEDGTAAVSNEFVVSTGKLAGKPLTADAQSCPAIDSFKVSFPQTIINNAENNRPADLPKLIKEMVLFSDSQEKFSGLHINTIHFNDAYGNCNLVLANSKEIIGYVVADCLKEESVFIYSTFPDALQKNLWRIVGKTTVDFSSLNKSIWVKGVFGTYSRTEAPLTIQAFESVSSEINLQEEESGLTEITQEIDTSTLTGEGGNVSVTIDPDNTLNESDKGDNVGGFGFDFFTGQFDLSIPRQPIFAYNLGIIRTLKTAVENIGEFSSTPFYLQYYLAVSIKNPNINPPYSNFPSLNSTFLCVQPFENGECAPAIKLAGIEEPKLFFPINSDKTIFFTGNDTKESCPPWDQDCVAIGVGSINPPTRNFVYSVFYFFDSKPYNALPGTSFVCPENSPNCHSVIDSFDVNLCELYNCFDFGNVPLTADLRDICSYITDPCSLDCIKELSGTDCSPTNYTDIKDYIANWVNSNRVIVSDPENSIGLGQSFGLNVYLSKTVETIESAGKPVFSTLLFAAEDCTDGVDNDGDEAIDCDDSDCEFDSACIVPGDDGDSENNFGESSPWFSAVLESCLKNDPSLDGHNFCDEDDDDLDNLIDRDDLDCHGFECLASDPNCKWPGSCSNGIDDDCDGKTDGQDPDCQPTQGNEAECAEFSDLGPAFQKSACCTDETDNDGDGDIDTADSDCTPSTELCTGCVDEDLDGLFDCGDPDCAEDFICQNFALPENDEIACTNSYDDDFDCRIDCGVSLDGIPLDPDCSALNGETFCRVVAEICNNGSDDDGDGDADCLDEDCFFDAHCVGETNCFNGIDDLTDEDTLADCADIGDCMNGSFIKIPDEPAWDSYCATCDPNRTDILPKDFCVSSGTKEICNNFEADGVTLKDDDGDLAANCDDHECIGFPGCIAEICDNKSDDDGDTLIDCADPFCFNAENCKESSNCDDNIDNDLDGLIDCADEADCQNSGYCGEDCNDGLDNDGDGLVDCLDLADCKYAKNCAPPKEICCNGLDDDKDGLIDENCNCVVKEVCSNGVDDDFDGLIDCDDAECWASDYCKAQLLPPINAVVQIVNPVVRVGDTQELRIVTEFGEGIPGLKVIIIFPSGTILELTTDEFGFVSFIASEEGNYQIIVQSNEINLASKFSATTIFATQFIPIESSVEFIFGESVRENPWYVPLLIVLSLIAGLLVYFKSVLIVKPMGKSAAQLKLDKVVRGVAGVIFFVVPFIVNRLTNFNLAVVAFIIELIVIFVLNFAFQELERGKKKPLKV